MLKYTLFFLIAVVFFECGGGSSDQLAKNLNSNQNLRNAVESPQDNRRYLEVADYVSGCADIRPREEFVNCLRGKNREIGAVLDSRLTIVNRLEVPQRMSLAKVEKIWEQYRDLHCKSVEYLFEGGTDMEIEFERCRIRITIGRINELREIYERDRGR